MDIKQRTSLNTLLAGEVSAAAKVASMVTAGKTRKFRLGESDIPSLIPSGAAVTVQSVKLSDLKMGDMICVRVGTTIAVRRFVKIKVTTSHILLLTAHENADKKEPLAKSNLLGRVESVTSAGNTFSPLKREGTFRKLWGMLTEFGTHKPFGLLSA
jgi:hypothetical protein